MRTAIAMTERQDGAWVHVGNSDRMISEDGVNFRPEPSDTHIVYCTGCGEAWSESGVSPPSEGGDSCACANPENKRWVAMSAGRFLWMGMAEPDESRLLAASAVAYRDGFRSGLAHSAHRLDGTIDQ